MRKFKFKAIVKGKVLEPKGFYYQGKYVILVGCVKSGSTVRVKYLVEEVDIEITEDK